MAYKKVVEMLGDNLASFLELVKKFLIDWKVDLKKLLHTFHNIPKEDFIGFINGTHEIVKKNSGLLTNLDYKLIRCDIQIVEQERDRKRILDSSFKFEMQDNFKNEIYAKLQNGKTNAEVLRESKILKARMDDRIMEEMNIYEINPDQIAERIIQIDKFHHCTIIGYCAGFMVEVFRFHSGVVTIYARKFGDWRCGDHLLSQDVDVV